MGQAAFKIDLRSIFKLNKTKARLQIIFEFPFFIKLINNY